MKPHYLMYYLSIYLSFRIYPSTGNYEDSLRDAKLATGFQPLFVKAIVRGKISEELNSIYRGDGLQFNLSCSILRLLKSYFVFIADEIKLHKVSYLNRV